MVCIAGTIALCQDTLTGASITTLPRLEDPFGYREVPVIFADSASSFPDTIDVRGVVIAVTTVPAGCGVMCWWGAALVRLDERPPGYERDTLHVAVRCLFGREAEFVGRRIGIRLSGLMRADAGGGCGLFFNRFDSHGFPYYKSSVDEFFIINGAR
jgi:hypothetical protein